MKQLSIITENRLGVVTQISEALAAKNINIESLDAKLAGNQVIVVLHVDQYDKALHIIHQLNNMQIVTEDAILVKLTNEPGALAKIARRFTNAGIGLRSIRFIQRDEYFGLVAICTDRTEESLQLVADVLVS